MGQSKTGKETTRGRPGKLTKKNKDHILASVKAGIPPDVACRAIGISHKTFLLWKQISRGELEPPVNTSLEEFIDFFAEFDECSAIAESSLLLQIRAAGKESRNWKANTWLLEKIDKARWGDANSSLEDIAIALGKASAITPEQIEQLVQLAKDGNEKIAQILTGALKNAQANKSSETSTTTEPNTQE